MTLRILISYITIGLISTTVLVADEPSLPVKTDGLASDLDAAVATAERKRESIDVGKYRDLPWHNFSVSHVVLGDLVESADALAQKYGPAGIPELIRIVEEYKDTAPPLARLTLSRLAKDQAAADVLVRLIALTEISFLPPNEARPLLERVIRESRDGGTQKRAAELLEIIGDSSSVEFLRQIKEERRQKYLVDLWGPSLSSLERRLSMKEPDRIERNREELAFWQAWAQGRGEITHLHEARAVAEKLHVDGVRFSLKFLKDKLQADHPLVPAIICVQREFTAIADLKPFASESSMRGGMVREALRFMGTDEAIRALGSGITPSGRAKPQSKEQEEITFVNHEIVRLLIASSGSISLEILTQLGSDPRYSEEEHREFLSAAEEIRTNLDQQGGRNKQ